MFNKSSPEGFKKMLDGVEMKAPVHGERTMLTTVRFAEGADVPIHQHPLFFPHVMGEVRWGCRGS